MQEFITRANIARFAALVAKEPDEAKRRLLEQMLDREKAALKALGGPHVAAVETGEHHAPPREPELKRDGSERPAN